MFNWNREEMGAQNPNDRRLPRIIVPLRVLLIALFVASNLMLLWQLMTYGFPDGFDEWFTTLSTLTISAIVIILVVLLERGYIKLVGLSLCITIWVVVTYWLIRTGQIYDNSVSGYFLIIMIASLTLGDNAALVSGFICIATTAVTFTLHAGSMDDATKLSLSYQLATLTVSLGVTALLMRFTVRSIMIAFERANQNQAALSKSNQELHEYTSALQQREQELQTSKAQFQAIYDAANVLILAHDWEDNIVYMNPHACKTLGYKVGEMIGKNITPLVEKSEADRGVPIREMILRDAKTHVEGFEQHYLTREGKRVLISWNVTALRGVDGQAAGILGVGRDITERKQAEQQIRRLQQLLQSITDSMPSALITLAPDGKVLTCNPVAKRMIGLSPDQIIGRSILEVHPGLHEYRGMFNQVMRDGNVAQRHRVPVTTDAGTAYRDVAIFPLVTPDLEGVVIRIDDVTQRVKLEEMMLQSAKLASVGGLAAGVAHEINNPLGAMMQSAQMLQIALDPERSSTRKNLEKHHIPPEALESYLQARGLAAYLKGIRQSGARAAKIVSDLLSFSRRSSPDVEYHNLNTLVKQTLDLAATDYDLRRKYDFRDIDIVYNLTPDLPDIICDAQQIQQVVLNLVRNAAQAMAEKRKALIAKGSNVYKPQLNLCTRQREAWIRLEVGNNGPKIPKKVRARLFEPFFTTKEVGEGTGLGLWLCWSIIAERHKGRIWIEQAGTENENHAHTQSEDRPNTCDVRFIIELPIAP